MMQLRIKYGALLEVLKIVKDAETKGIISELINNVLHEMANEVLTPNETIALAVLQAFHLRNLSIEKDVYLKSLEECFDIAAKRFNLTPSTTELVKYSLYCAEDMRNWANKVITG